MKKLYLTAVVTILLVGALAVGVMAQETAVGMNYWRATNDIKVNSQQGESSFHMMSVGGQLALTDLWSVGFIFESGDGDKYDNKYFESVDLTNMQIGAKYAIQPGITVNGGYLSTKVDVDNDDYTLSGLFAGLSVNLDVSDEIKFYGDFAFSPFLNVDSKTTDDDGTVTYVNLSATYALSAFNIEAGYRMRNYESDLIKLRFSGPFIGINARF